MSWAKFAIFAIWVLSVTECCRGQGTLRDRFGEPAEQPPVTFIIELKSGPLATVPKAQRAEHKLLLAAERRQFRETLRAIENDTPDSTTTVELEYENVLHGMAVSIPPKLEDRVRNQNGVNRMTRDFGLEAQLHRSVPQIRADTVHLSGLTGKGIVVAIVDSGVDYRHLDLGGGLGPSFKVIGGYDWVNNDSDPRDDFGHGTHVAGIVAARGQTLGVAPDARLLAYKVLNSRGHGEASRTIAAIDLAVDPDGNPETADGANVINLSLGGLGHPNDPLCRACDHASRLGSVCVVAAGNSGEFDLNHSPAGAATAITVGSVGATDVLSEFTNKGPSALYAVKPDVLAPGESIVSTKVGGGKRPMSGTSMSCAHVSGLAALILQKRPQATPKIVKSLIATTARDDGYSVLEQGSGRIDALAAIESRASIEPGVLQLESVNRSMPVWTGSRELTVTNLGASPVEYRAAVDATALQPGVSGTITEAVTVAPGNQGVLRFTLTVETGRCPPLREWPWGHAGLIRVEGDGQQWRVPFFCGDELADEFEPNDSALQATPISVTARRRVIQRGGRTRIEPNTVRDVDWYQFPLTKGQVIAAWVDAEWLGSPLKPALEMLNPNLSVASHPGNDGDQRVTYFRANVDGTHYLKVSGADETTSGFYRLYASVLPQESAFWYPELPSPVNDVSFLENGDRLQQSQIYSLLAQFKSPLGAGPFGLLNPEFVVIGGRGVLASEITIGIGSNTGVAKQARSTADRLRGIGGVLAASRNGSLSIVGTGIQTTNELWEMAIDGNWLLRQPTTLPKPRRNSSLLFDPTRNVTWMIGGYADGEYLNETWSWNGTDWKQFLPTGVIWPRPRHSPALAFDEQRGVVAMYGGYMGMAYGGNAFDHWEWDGTRWSVSGAKPVPQVYRPLMSYDDERRRLVLIDTSYQTMWEYDDANKTWSSRPDGRIPESAGNQGYPFGMTYDPMRKETFLLVGGSQIGRPETWSWDGQVWKRWSFEFPRNVILQVGALFFDARVQRLRLLGSKLNDTNTTLWTLEAEGWQQVEMTNTPLTSLGAAVAFEASTQRLLRFGGDGPLRHRIELRKSPDAAVTATETLGGNDLITGLRAAPDGNTFVLTQSSQLQVRDRDAKVLRSWPRPYPSEVNDITRDGSLVALAERTTDSANSVSDVIVDTLTGDERFRKSGDSRVALGNQGKLLVLCGNRSVYGRFWNATAKTYDDGWRFVSDPDERFLMARSSDDGSLVAVAGSRPGHIAGEAGISVHLLDGNTGQLLARFHRDDDRRIGRLDGIANVVPNADGSLVGIATWGRDRRSPETFVLSRHSGTPLWELATLGSARCLDLAGTRLVVGTKGVHATVGRGFGEVHSADLSSIADKIPPNVTDASANPRQSAPGTAVLITAAVDAPCTTDRVVAQIESPRDCVVAHLPLLDDGRHGDGQAGDGLWGACWPTESRPTDYVVTILATNRQGVTATVPNRALFTTRPQPWVTVESAFTEQFHWVPGKNSLGLRLKNRGSRAANAVKVQLNCPSASATPATDDEPNSQSLTTIAESDEATLPPTSFTLHLQDTVTATEPIPLTVLITDSERHRWVERIIVVPSRRAKTR